MVESFVANYSFAMKMEDSLTHVMCINTWNANGERMKIGGISMIEIVQLEQNGLNLSEIALKTRKIIEH